VVFRVTDDGYADAEALGDGTLGDVFGGVIGAFRVDVWAKVFEERFDVRLGEEENEIDIAEGGNELRTSVLVEDGAAGTFEAADAGISIDGDDKDVALLFCSGEITDVADVQSVEATVGEDDALALALEFCERSADRFLRLNFGLGGPHKAVYVDTSEADLWMASRSSARETVAVPRFMTTRPPAMLAIWAASRGEADEARARV